MPLVFWNHLTFPDIVIAVSIKYLNIFKKLPAFMHTKYVT